MRIDQFPRHKSTQGFLAAKYPTVITYALVALMTVIPGVRNFAWVVAFFSFFREKDSTFLRLHAATQGFWSIFVSILLLVMQITEDVIFMQARRSESQTAYIVAIEWQDLLDRAAWAVVIVTLVYITIQAVLAYYYRFWNTPGLSKLAKRLEFNTRQGPLR